MKDHVNDLLSAYMDDELPTADRTAVEGHLRECSECARRLEDLAAVDAAAREMPLDVPPAYFEAFPARVRARLKPRVMRRRPPAWAWAAAAGLLLAVLTPWTLREKREPASAAPEAAPPARQGEVPREKERDALVAASPAAEELLDRKMRQKDKAAAPGSRPASAAPATPAFAANAPPREAYAVAATPPPTTLSASRAGDLRSEVGQKPAGGGFAAEPAEAEMADRVAAKTAPPKSESARPRRDTAPEPRSEGRLGKENEQEKKAVKESRQGGMAGAAAPAPQADEEARYRSLRGRRSAASAGAARELREAWRAFLRAYPGSPWADEARVGLIEAGAEAYRLGGDPRDRAEVERDAEEYLRREDSAQADRVRALLRSLAR